MKNLSTGTLAQVLLISIFTLGLTTGCLEKAAEEPSTDSGTTNKATLSSWATANAAWAIRLDLAGANITGTPFTLTIKFSDNSETHCSATINGTEASGSYNVSGCASTTPGSGSMSDSTGGAAFNTGGAGTYVNNGASFYWCRANSSCFTYY
ncbi:hypothetical protein [Bdellovibrio svalbardensis]|uniref:Lipoprotein n=1 Tax=Bdellovibrio svalbardensis TaxID=2972972 RepID=A0ABT6DLT7_9BACT|nr:hypothetical protein [Bdellovibrio svalbardensis]MDG0816781.1 hypothetical protein [Bdellovibrio svalbardensis]